MLTELLPKKYSFNIGESVISMRYTLAALLSLEQQGLAFSDIFNEKLKASEILEFFKAGLCEEFDDEHLAKIVYIVGFEKLWEHCVNAMTVAFPEPEKNVVPKPPNPNDEEFSFTRLRVLICDVMGKSEDFFWQSTPAELISRWLEYAYSMGYAEPPEKILEFDVEGM